MKEQFNLSEKKHYSGNEIIDKETFKFLNEDYEKGFIKEHGEEVFLKEDVKTFIKKLKDRIAGEISYAEPNIKKWKIEEIIDTLAGEELTQNHSPKDKLEETHGKLKESLPKPSGSQNQKEKSEE